MVWKPHVTVAAVIERDNRFLLVEEETPHGLQFNQPAGHFEQNEDLISAVKGKSLRKLRGNLILKNLFRYSYGAEIQKPRPF